MTAPDEHARTMGGMLAAIEYARTQYHGMRGAVPLADAQFGLEFIRDDCARGGLDLTGALAAITLRAAELACQASAAAGRPLTVEEFLGELERELTPPGDLSSL